MRFDLRQMGSEQRYKILSSTVTPRPIAWITSRSADGIRNCAPYSFFNVMGSSPPTLAIGLLPNKTGLKDSARNILAMREFVVHLVSESMAPAMNITCMDAPPEVDEITCAGLATVPADVVSCDLICGVPAAFECRILHAIETGPDQVVVIGEVLVVHIADEFVQNEARLHFDTPAMKLVARMHGSGWYARSTDLFQMQRPTYEGWIQESDRESSS